MVNFGFFYNKILVLEILCFTNFDCGYARRWLDFLDIDWFFNFVVQSLVMILFAVSLGLWKKLDFTHLLICLL